MSGGGPRIRAKKPPRSALIAKYLAEGGPNDIRLKNLRAADRRRARKQALARARMIDEFKLERGCADCGFNKHPAALEFDHRPGTVKEFGISQLRSCWKRSWLKAAILKEIEKCDVVCANCHRVRTCARKQWGRPLSTVTVSEDSRKE